MNLKPYLSFESENQISVPSFAYTSDKDCAHNKNDDISAFQSSVHNIIFKSHTKKQYDHYMSTTRTL